MCAVLEVDRLWHCCKSWCAVTLSTLLNHAAALQHVCLAVTVRTSQWGKFVSCQACIDLPLTYSSQHVDFFNIYSVASLSPQLTEPIPTIAGAMKTVQCSLGYAAPEVVVAFQSGQELEVTAAQDIWALGVPLHHTYNTFRTSADARDL